jgi:hypothetical protein
MKLTTHLHLNTDVKKYGAIPPFPYTLSCLAHRKLCIRQTYL